MTAKFSYALTDLGNQVVRLGAINGLTTKAEKGTVGTSSIPFDNPAGSLTIEPFRSFLMEEFACSAPVVYKGYITDRSYARTESFRTGAANRIDVSLIDLNAIFSMKLITHSTFHYLRPAETDVARIAWLMAQVLDTIVVYDHGLIDTTNPVNLTKVDYSGQFPLQVMNDCANRSGKNFFLYNDPATGQISLAYFKSSDAVTLFPSTLSISNVKSEQTATVIAPLMDAKEVRDPSLVYDGVYMPYNGGVVYVRAAGRFLARDVVGPSANTSDRDRAIELAQRMLDNHDSEQTTVECTLRLPASQVNLLIAGMGVHAKFSHLPDWTAGVDVQVLERTVKQDEESDQYYNVTIRIGLAVLVNFTTGDSADNSRVWPNDQPPFQSGAGGAFVYVQSAKTADNSDTTPTATFGAAPTTGNLLVAMLLAQQPGSGSPSPSDFVATFPDGWSLALGPVGTSANGRMNAMWIAYKFATAGEPSTVAPTISLSGVSPQNGFIDLAEYSGPTAVEIVATSNGAYSGPSATATIPSVTPLVGVPTLLVALVVNNPGYSTSYSAGWNVRQQSLHAGPRQNLAYVDQIIASATGSYTGTATGNLGDPSEYWYIPVVAFASSAGEPAIGQPVAPESATADGSRVIYTTNYPYVPGSLVVKVNGNVVVVDETDPTTGTFTLPAPPAVGAIITWTYNVADPAPTGANNPAADPSGTSIPPAPGTMPGGDGINRQPQLSFVPAETPDGVRTVFTISPYVAGTTLVYINGLIQRITTDYAETSPGTGVITFTTAPWTGSNIVVVAMPYLAAPPPTGTRSVTWAAPVTTATYTIGPAQFASSPTDVSAAMNAYLLTVPDGSTIQWPVAGDFTLSQGLQLSNRHNLILDGRGTTLRVQAGASGANQLASSIIVGHAYGGSWTLGATDIQIHDFILVGNNPTPGVFTSGTEAQANLEMTGCTRLEVYNITGSGAWGDFLFVEDITDGWFHNNTGTNAGRNGASVISGNRVLIETSAFTTSGYNTFDVEPNTSAQACYNIVIRTNTAAMWSNAFMGVDGSHTGAPIHGVTVTGNSISGKSLLTVASNGGVGAHMTNIAVTNNTSTAAAVAGPVLIFGYTDNVTASGNTQPLSSGSLVSTTSCTNVVL